MAEETQNIQTIGKRDQDHTFLGEIFAVISGFRCPAEIEAPAVDPYHYGKLLGGTFRRRPDIQIETVLALNDIGCERAPVSKLLIAGRRVMVRLQDVCPGFARGGWTPAPFAGGRSGKWNPFVNMDAADGHPLA